MTRVVVHVQPKSKGRPTKDSVERLKVKVWYLAVKARKPWSDYRLDQEFASEDDKNERKGADRLRIFETIRRRNVSPSAGEHPKRRFDLVTRVDSHPDFKGTAGIYFSPFWLLLQGNFISLPKVLEFTKEQLKRCGIHRPSSALNFINASGMRVYKDEFQKIDNAKMYEVSLRTAISELPLDLDLIALLGGLFREAFLVCELDTAVVLKKLFLEVIDEFCSQPWLSKVEFELLDVAERKILHWQMGEYFEGKELYDDWPPLVVERPLIKLNTATNEIVAHEKDIYSQIVSEVLKRIPPETKL